MTGVQTCALPICVLIAPLDLAVGRVDGEHARRPFVVAGTVFGIRGWIDATDLNTGKQAWRTYTIPGAGEPGNETWKDGKEHWKHGGASVWVTATYDRDTETIYQGIGNAGPDWDTEYRPGDNKWAASVLAINAADGKIKWGYQYTPNDPYDYDEISEQDRKSVV